MTLIEGVARLSQSLPRRRGILSAEERESIIQGAIWSFGVEGVTITREEAEKALEAALAVPLPEF